MILLYSLLFSILYLPLQVNSWGSVGHEIVATIAQANLALPVRAHLCTILPNFTSYTTKSGEKHCHLAPLASWPDNVRFHLPWSSKLHYVNPVNDHPPIHCNFGNQGWTSEENVLTAIRNYTSLLSNTSLPTSDRDISLRFLVHLIGDLHQPLHLTGSSRGGNDIKVHFEGRLNSLHSVWDSQILNKQIRELSNYTGKFSEDRIESTLRGKNYDSYIRWVLKEGLGQGDGDGEAWWKEESKGWLDCPEREVVKKGYRARNPLKFEVFQGKVGSNGLKSMEQWFNDEEEADQVSFSPQNQFVLSSPKKSSRTMNKKSVSQKRKKDWKKKKSRGTTSIGTLPPSSRCQRDQRGICIASKVDPLPFPFAKQGNSLRLCDQTKFSSKNQEPRINSITDRVDDTDLPICPLFWSKSMHPLACQYGFASPVPVPSTEEHSGIENEIAPELDIPEYLGRVDDDKIIQLQLAKAGIRLAGILNSLLLEEATLAAAFDSSS